PTTAYRQPITASRRVASARVWNAHRIADLLNERDTNGPGPVYAISQRLLDVVWLIFQFSAPPPRRTDSLHKPREDRRLHLAISKATRSKPVCPLPLLVGRAEQFQNTIQVAPLRVLGLGHCRRIGNDRIDLISNLFFRRE